MMMANLTNLELLCTAAAAAAAPLRLIRRCPSHQAVVIQKRFLGKYRHQQQHQQQQIIQSNIFLKPQQQQQHCFDLPRRRELHATRIHRQYAPQGTAILGGREMEMKDPNDEFEIMKQMNRERVDTPKIHREPFLRDLLAGKFEPSYLEYPQLTAEEHAYLTAYLSPIEKIVAKIDSKKVTANKHLPADILEQLVQHEAFGGIIPFTYNGMQLDNLQYARLLHTLAADPNLATQVYIQQSWIARSILKYGSEEQKSEYLPGLARATLYGGWALAEPASGSDHGSMQGHAVFNPQRNTYTIRCTKSYVTNARDADFFIVFVKVPTVPESTTRPGAHVPETASDVRFKEIEFVFGPVKRKLPPTPQEVLARPVDENGAPVPVLQGSATFDAQGIDTTWRTTAFIVDAHTPGVRIEEDNAQKTGLTACAVNKVIFDACEVDASTCILGPIGSGFAVAAEALSHDRHMIPILVLPTLKRLFNGVIQHYKNSTRFYRPLYEFALVRDRIWSLAQIIFTIESSCFLTAFLNSQTINPQYDIESAASKNFANANVARFLQEIRSAYAALATNVSPELESELEQAERDLRLIMHLDGSDAVSKLYIALSCLQTAGVKYEEFVHKMRHPMQYPWDKMKSLTSWTSRDPMGTNQIDKPYIFPEDYVHPFLETPAKMIEDVYLLLRAVSGLQLVEVGRNIFEEQTHLAAISDLITSVFVMTASLGRASRSICLGIYRNEEECGLVAGFCTDELFRSMAARAAYCGDWSTERNFKEDQALASMAYLLDEGYCCELPTARNLL